MLLPGRRRVALYRPARRRPPRPGPPVPASGPGELLGLDPDRDALLTRLPERVPLLAEILLGEVVDVGVGAGLATLRDTAAHLHVLVGVLGVDGGQRGRGVHAEQPVLHPAPGG